MPRSYGITNVAPYASAPPVGQSGDTYWNTTNQTLYISNGSAWVPWPTGGPGGTGQGQVVAVKSITANATLNDGDMALVDCTAGNVTITIAPTVGNEYTVKRVDNTQNILTVAPSAGNIDGDATATIIGRNTAAVFVGDGTNIRVGAINGVVSTNPYYPLPTYVRYGSSYAGPTFVSGTFYPITGWAQTEALNQSGMLGGISSGVLTISQAGLYLMAARITWQNTPDTGARFQLRLTRGDGAWVQNDMTPASSSRNLAHEVIWPVYMAAGQTMVVQCSCSFTTTAPTLHPNGTAADNGGHEWSIAQFTRG